MTELLTERTGLSPEVDFRKIIGELSRTRSGYLEVFADFARLGACALALQTREKEYLEVAQKYEKEELSLFSKALAGLVNEMQSSLFTDVLGPYYTEINSSASAKARGEYYTPPALSQVMAGLLFSPDIDGVPSDVDLIIEKGKPITVQDPACGSGGMILAMAELFAPKNAVDLLRMTLIDISPLACDMAYINTALWGIPAKILQGSALTMSFKKVLRNVHWARVGEDQRLSLEKMMDLLNTSFAPRAEKETELPQKPNITLPELGKRSLDDDGQFQLGLDF